MRCVDDCGEAHHDAVTKESITLEQKQQRNYNMDRARGIKINIDLPNFEFFFSFSNQFIKDVEEKLAKIHLLKWQLYLPWASGNRKRWPLIKK